MVGLVIATAAIIGFGTVLAVFAFARAFPQSALVHLIMPPGTGESVIIRQEIRSETEQARRIMKIVTPALGAAVSSAPEMPGASQQLGRVVVLTSDGLAISLQPDRLSGEYMIANQDTRVAAELSGVIGDIGFLRVSTGAPPLSVVGAQSLDEGTGVWILKYDLGSGVNVARATLSSLQAENTDPSLIQASDIPARRYALDRNFNSDWEGAAVVDADARLIGLIEVDAQGQSRVWPATAWEGLLSQASRREALGYPVLGVQYFDLTRPHGLSELPRKGAYLAPMNDGESAVLPGSPADVAGFRNGDVVTAVDDVPLTSRFSLSDAVARYRSGAKVRFSILRSGSTMTLSAVLESPK